MKSVRPWFVHFLLANVVMLASFCLATPAHAATVTGRTDRLVWSSTDGSTATITGCGVGYDTCNYKILNIPSTVTGEDGTTYTVTKIGYFAFHFADDLARVSIPDTVTVISDMAFASRNGNLVDVTFGNGLARIEGDAFLNVTSIDRLRFKGNAPYVSPYGLVGLSSSVKAHRLPSSTGFGNETNWTAGQASIPLDTWAIEAPTAPTDLVVTPSSGSLSLSFTDAYNNGSEISTYEYSLDNGATWHAKARSSQLGPVVIDGVVNGTSYQVKLRAVNAVGSGASSASVSARPSGVPSPPTNLVSHSTTNSLSITFTPGADNGNPITNYEYSFDDGDNRWWPMSPAAPSGPVVISGLATKNVYSVKLRAVNAAGIGQSTEWTSLRTLGSPDITSRTNIQLGNGFISARIEVDDWGSPVTALEYRVDNASPWIALPSIDTTNPVVISGLTNGQNYELELHAVNAVGSNGGGVLIPGKPGLAPSPPSNLRVRSGDGALIVTFEFGANNGNYISGFQYSLDDGMTWLDTSPINAYPMTISGLVNGRNYSVKVRNRNAVGWSASSVSATGRPMTVPTAPTNLQVTRGDERLTVAFTEPVSNGGSDILNYQVSLDDGTNQWWFDVSPTTTSSPISFGWLINGTNYSVIIRAVNAMGPGESSVAVNGRPVGHPAAPTDLVATADVGKLSIAFTVPNNGGDEILHYEYSIDDGGTWAVASPGTEAGHVVINGLANGTNYSLKLRAVNGGGPGDISDVVTGTPKGVPSAPTNVVATRGDKSLSLTFTPASANGEAITNYEYSLNDGVSWVAISPSVVASPMVINGLTNGTNYTVKLRAVNAVGKGLSSVAATGRPSTVPSAPTNLSVRRDDGSLSISFTAGADNGEPMTKYQYSLNGGASWASVSRSDVKSPVTISGLTNGTDYSVMLRAVNIAGFGAMSSAVGGRPALPLLSDSAGVDIPVAKDPAATIASNVDVAVNGVRVSIAVVAPIVASKVKVTFYIFTLKPTKKGVSAVTQAYKVKSSGTTFAVVKGKPKTTYIIQVTAVTSSGSKKTWTGPSVTTQ